jgi:PAS domain S-box-containing protein
MTSISSDGPKMILNIEILESIPDPCYIADGEGRIKYFNPAMKSLFGYGEEEYSGEPISMLCKDLETATSLFREPGRKGDCTRKGEIQAVSKSGRIFPCWITTILFHDPRDEADITLGLVRDMSDYCDALIALKPASDRFEAFAGIASRISAFTDIQMLSREVLQAVSSLLPIKAGFLLLISEETGSLTFSEGYNLPTKEYNQYRLDNSWDTSLEGQVVREKLSILIEDVSSDPRAVQYVDGSMSLGLIPLQTRRKVVGVLSLATGTPHRLDQADIEFLHTLGSHLGIYFENAGLLEKLRETNFQLGRKNQDLEELLSIISHDLRSPLATIAGYASLLMKGGGDHSQDERSQFATTIFQKTQETSERFDDLLDIFRVSPLKGEGYPQPFSVRDVVQSALEEAASPEVRDRFSIIIPESLPRLLGYTDQLNHIFTNLLSNAFKFIGEQENPTVTVSYERVDDPGGPLQRFAISDNGMGISPDYINDVFKPFFRVPKLDKIPGTGVGLAVVSRILRNHRGSIEITSTEGKGTTFTFTLPWKETKNSPVSRIQREGNVED